MISLTARTLIIAAIAGVIIATVAFGLVRMLGSAVSIYDHLISAKTNVSAGDIVFAQEDIHAAQESLDTLSGTLQFFSFAKGIPGLGDTVSATQTIASVGGVLLNSFDQTLSVARDAIHVFVAPSAKMLSGISAEDKKKIVHQFLKALPTLSGVNANVALALRSLRSIDDQRLVGPLRGIKNELLEKGDALARLLTIAEPFVEQGPAILGFSGAKTYLLLLQNNTETRGTGGFIGTYGILIVKDGDIVSVRTDNIYNLDDRAPASFRVRPPAPFLEYFPPKERWWYLRDSNWSPDFSDAAQAAEWFYYKEGGRDKLDGVIAFTPDVIASLLSIVGPVDAAGVRFTSENFVENLQYQVEQGYNRRGIPERERKEIVGVVMRAIIDRAYKIKTDQVKTLADLMRRNLDEKHILLYFNDPKMQEFAANSHWSGEIRNVPGDFLMVADSNMGSLKTDSVMKKRISYSLSEQKDGTLVAHVELFYQNNGRYSWKTTDYKDYVRVYAPKGADLLRVEGAMKRDGSKNIGAIDTTEEHGKVSFGCFITVPVGKSHRLTFEYALPPSIQTTVASGLYTFFVQKPSGVTGQEFEGAFQFLRPVKKKGTNAAVSLQRPNRALLKSTLYTDQSIALEF